MEDLIRRSDAIKGAKRLHNLFSSPFYNRDRVEMIEAYFNDIPSADRWIPCSERLPKENTEVLMSLEWGVDIGEYRNGEWHSEWINHYDDGNVLAWMPLPKPWKGEDDGKDIQSEAE